MNAYSSRKEWAFFLYILNYGEDEIVSHLEIILFDQDKVLGG